MISGGLKLQPHSRVKMLLLSCIFIAPLIAHSKVNLRILVDIVDENNNAIDDCDRVVVFLTPLKKVSLKQKPIKATMVSYQKNFKPAVLPIVQGSTVDFPNKDVILHNVFSRSKTKVFDLGLYKKGEGKKVTFNKSGLVKVFCNIHPKMVGYILVLDTPYFKKSNTCQYDFNNLPVGEYQSTAWYQYGDLVTKDVKVLSGKKREYSLSVNKGDSHNIKIKKSKRFRQHKNKWGHEYKSKY